jgi:hypothetical protein
MLTTQTFSGQIHTTVIDPPPPPADGQMSTGVADQRTIESSEAVDPVSQMALNILQSVLSLL